jgi:hypothetical protein
MMSLQSRQEDGGLSLARFIARNDVTAWRNVVSACVTALQTWRNGVTVSDDTISRREHVSLVVGFRRLDLRSGSSIWSTEAVGLPLVEAHQRAPDRPKSQFLRWKYADGEQATRDLDF